MKSAILFLNGPLPPETMLLPLLENWKNPLVICADGGYLYARDSHIPVDIVIGDLDTIRANQVQLPAAITVIEQSDQNMNDMEKALIYLRDHQVNRVLILGITGGRTDHVISNFSVLSRYLKTFKFELIGHEARLYILFSESRHILINTKTGRQISLLAFPQAAGINTRGLRYPLNDGLLKWGISEGSSNQADEDTVEISIQSGLLFVFENF